MADETPTPAPTDGEHRPRDFVRQLIDQHVEQGRWGQPGDPSVVRTRFPPEPNGFLHIGHAKSICLNFGIAEEYGGRCNLRFDDTNPEKEEDAYVRSIIRDVRWLGFRWPGAHPAEDEATDGVRFASDYFQQMFDHALLLIEHGRAYVDEQPHERIRAQRGTLTEPGTPSPFRDRPPAESLERFTAMARGRLRDGAAVLRAKIDMASPNINLRDPVMYRVLNAPHHRTGDTWHVYPMYDWAHGLEDSIEGITNSICTLEFENHRPLYDWFIDAINQCRAAAGREPIHHPQQTEFARLNPTYVVTSKRKLRELVDSRRVEGWDDPRMPTISGLRRRGYTPEAIRSFCDALGTTKFNATHDIGLLENAAREDLNARAPRRMAVLRPLRLTITNWADGGDPKRLETLHATNNPEDPAAGTREVPFGAALYVERDDFMEEPAKKWFRLAPGKEVRLRYGYWVTCREAVKNDAGEVVELRCTYDPLTKGGESPPPDAEGNVRKVKGTLHWVEATTAVQITARLFDRLYNAEKPGKTTDDHLDDLNEGSLETLEHAVIEPNWRTSDAERAAGTGRWTDGIERFQFERNGYFCLDGKTGAFNRTVSLKDSWAKEAKK